MYHELPNGEVKVFDIDLSVLPQDRFEAARVAIERHAYISSLYPGLHRMKVYWNLVESPEAVIDLPPGSVVLHHGNK